MGGELVPKDKVGEVVGRLTATGIDSSERRRLLAELTGLLASSARAAGARAAVTGAWLADVVDGIAPHIPVRDLATLSEHHDGLTGQALAEDLVRTASLATAGVGAAGGALAAVQHAAPPTLLLAPVQLAAETVAVVAVELKLVAELHVVHGRAPLAPAGHVAAAYLQSWASRSVIAPGVAPPAVGVILGAAARVQLRRRLARRLGRNVSTMAPFLAGAVAGAELNRRETRALGAALLEQFRS